MAYIGKIPAAAALTSSDIADSIITEAKMADDAISLAELKAGTDGEVISWDASGNPVAIGAGSSGEFLKSQGAGSQPVFAAAGGGKIGQVFNVIFTGTQEIDSTPTWVDITSLSQAITPAATSSKILVHYTVSVSGASDSATRILRDSTALAIGDAEGSNRGRVTQDGANRNNAECETHSFTYLDSPSTTSAVTYKVQGVGATININRSQADSDDFTYFRSASSLTLMEVLA